MNNSTNRSKSSSLRDTSAIMDVPLGQINDPTVEDRLEVVLVKHGPPRGAQVIITRFLGVTRRAWISKEERRFAHPSIPDQWVVRMTDVIKVEKRPVSSAILPGMRETLRRQKRELGLAIPQFKGMTLARFTKLVGDAEAWAAQGGDGSETTQASEVDWGTPDRAREGLADPFDQDVVRQEDVAPDLLEGSGLLGDDEHEAADEEAFLNSPAREEAFRMNNQMPAYERAAFDDEAAFKDMQEKFLEEAYREPTSVAHEALVAEEAQANYKSDLQTEF